MHEGLYKRNDFSPLSEKLQEYFWQHINCVILCGWYHMTYGDSKGFRRWFVDRQIELYGEEKVEEYLANAPLKQLETIESLRG